MRHEALPAKAAAEFATKTLKLLWIGWNILDRPDEIAYFQVPISGPRCPESGGAVQEAHFKPELPPRRGERRLAWFAGIKLGLIHGAPADGNLKSESLPQQDPDFLIQLKPRLASNGHVGSCGRVSVSPP